MNNEALIRNLIKGSIYRAIQESVAALGILIAFTAILLHSEVGSAQYFGCLLILVSAGFISGVVWSYALSYRLLRSHPASDASFWREAFHVQARLLRWVPLWYCAPLSAGGIVFLTPFALLGWTPFLILAAIFITIFAGIGWLNRRAAACLENAAMKLDG